MANISKSFQLFVDAQRSNPCIVLSDVDAVHEYLADVHGVVPSRIHIVLAAKRYIITVHNEDGSMEFLKIHMPVWMVEYLDAALDR